MQRASRRCTAVRKLMDVLPRGGSPPVTTWALSPNSQPEEMVLWRSG